MVSYVDIIDICHSVAMSCEVATLPFKAHANYGTCSIDFEHKFNQQISIHNLTQLASILGAFVQNRTGS